MDRIEFEEAKAKGITKFRVIKPRMNSNSEHKLEFGEILTLSEDDGSHVPYFYKENGFKTDCYLSRLEPVVPQQKDKFKVAVFASGNKVIAKLIYNKSVISEAEAKCSPEDEFNFLTGLQIAITRLVRQQPCAKFVLPKEVLNAELV